MKKVIITNAFSIDMLEEKNEVLAFRPTEIETVRNILTVWIPQVKSVESAVGHADTAAIFSSVLGTEVPCNRTSVTLSKGTMLIVGQYTGPRLDEGATLLPEGAEIKWWFIHRAEDIFHLEVTLDQMLK